MAVQQYLYHCVSFYFMQFWVESIESLEQPQRNQMEYTCLNLRDVGVDSTSQPFPAVPQGQSHSLLQPGRSGSNTHCHCCTLHRFLIVVEENLLSCILSVASCAPNYNISGSDSASSKAQAPLPTCIVRMNEEHKAARHDTPLSCCL